MLPTMLQTRSASLFRYRLTKQREEITARLGDLNTALSAKHDKVAELYEPDRTHFGIVRDTEIRAASQKKSSSEILSEVSAGNFPTILTPSTGSPASRQLGAH